MMKLRISYLNASCAYNRSVLFQSSMVIDSNVCNGDIVTANSCGALTVCDCMAVDKKRLHFDRRTLSS